MTYVFTPPKLPTLPIQDSDRLFPVHRLYCIGRNYADHAVEMGHDPDKEPPFFFQKNPDGLVPLGGRVAYPPKSSDVHHEIELVVALKTGGTNIPVDNALDHVFGYAAGLDMTRRDLQGEAKKLGRPWEIGKAFAQSAPCSALASAASIGHPDHGVIALKVNGDVRQSSDLDQMIWKVPEMISYLSDYFTLAPGDLIFSGTPAGVGPVQRGDRLHGSIDGVGTIDIEVV